MAKKPIAKKSKAVKVSFHDQLILTKWLWSHLNPSMLEKMRDQLDKPDYEGIEIDGDNVGQTKFFTVLTSSLFNKHLIDGDTLRRYDLNIAQYWQQITEKRNEKEGHILNLKYFQYLSLLFTEIYLDHYFNRQLEMIDALDIEIDRYNESQKELDTFQSYIAEDLNKVSFWNATGSGKTLLMHVNILQYLHYFHQKYGVDKNPDQIILLTPNEGLSHQHFHDFELSGISATIFDKNRSRNSLLKDEIQIIDINKLSDRDGDKTVAASSLEGQNLVLIDEGHRGTSSAGIWMERRDILTRNGFSFEYSATFGQAVNKASNVHKSYEDTRKIKAKLEFPKETWSKLTSEQKDKIQLDDLEKLKCRRESLREAYAKNILFDYSYKYFYQDGYGKEVNILNMKEYSEEQDRDLYLTACLLAFYQQQYLFKKDEERLVQFNIENPLWVFVGNKVNDDDSDILTIIQFLSRFLDPQHKAQNIEWLQDLITNKSRLVDNSGVNIFTNRFSALHGQVASKLYEDILLRFFNASTNQRLNVVRVAANTGELKLQVGENNPFALINVGDETGLYKLCETLSLNNYFDTRNDDFSPSLFGTLNNTDCSINLLIGSKKFTEGWSSWRVSTMGLLNMGTGEGSQIIQLFGRGVRLKGENFSLKRTPREIYTQASYKDLYLDFLQTLNIFGLKANYMEAFREYLNDEGIILNQDLVTLDFKTNVIKPTTKLKTLVLKDGYKDNQVNGFKAKIKPWIFTQVLDLDWLRQNENSANLEKKIKKPFVILDLYPRLQSFHTDRSKEIIEQDKRQNNIISRDLMNFFDFDMIYLELLQYKAQRGYSNLKITQDNIVDFCCNKDPNDWYKLLIDGSELTNTVAGIIKQQWILIELLKAYMDKIYSTFKNAYEGQYYTVQEFDLVNSPLDDLPIDICQQYTLTAKEDQNSEASDYFERIKNLQALVENGTIDELAPWQQDGSFRAITFDRHLYYPLFDKTDDNLPFTWSPALFDYTKNGQSSEVQFVTDLQEYVNSDIGKEILDGYQLYLFRNPDNKYRGLGFALAGNFYPDFLMWLVHKESGKQFLTLVDPKGIRNMNSDDAKIEFYKEIKTIEADIADEKLVLNSFILSVTPIQDIINCSMNEVEFSEKHVLFMNKGMGIYLRQMFEKIFR